MEQQDHANTLVLLIGTSRFPEHSDIRPIPNVEANLRILKNLLTEHELIGIPEANITVSLNEDGRSILKKLTDLSRNTRTKQHTLIVYYSGHGIMSATDYELYLTTAETTMEYLDIEGIGIEVFKKHIRSSAAGRKIVILDCCHSGHIIGSMGSMSSKLQSEIQGFEGTYVMTSAAEDEPSLFPDDKPGEPTHFTGRLADIISEGIDDHEEFLSLRNIFKTLEHDFAVKGLPKPQQSNFNTADQLWFARNRKFMQARPADEMAWEAALKKNNQLAFLDFIEAFPGSRLLREAHAKLTEFEESEIWRETLDRNTINAFISYKLKFPEGKYIAEANRGLQELRKREEEKSKQVKPVPPAETPAPPATAETTESTQNKTTPPQPNKKVKKEPQQIKNISYALFDTDQNRQTYNGSLEVHDYEIIIKPENGDDIHLKQVLTCEAKTLLADNLEWIEVSSIYEGKKVFIYFRKNQAKASTDAALLSVLQKVATNCSKTSSVKKWLKDNGGLYNAPINEKYKLLEYTDAYVSAWDNRSSFEHGVTGVLTVNSHSITYKNNLNDLTLRNIHSVVYLPQGNGNAYNYIDVYYYNEQRQLYHILFYRYAFFEEKPTGRMYDAIQELISKGKLVLET